jgi:hypothetical protein
LRARGIHIIVRGHGRDLLEAAYKDVEHKHDIDTKCLKIVHIIEALSMGSSL